MNTPQPDHIALRELLYLEPDEELNAGDRSRLQQHLAVCSDCQRERQELAQLNELVDRSTIPVDEEFTREVMDRLPPTGWETRSPSTWWVALAVVFGLAIASALLIGTASDEVVSAVPLAAASAVWELLSSSVLAGAGLMAASWKGLGIAFQEVLGRSVWNMIAFGVIVICLDLLLLRYLLRAPAAGARAETEDEA